MKVYTGGGDKGQTSLFSGERVAKHALRIDAYGDLDELNSVIGSLLAFLPRECSETAAQLDTIQGRLFQAGAWFATQPDSTAINYLDDFPKQFATELEQDIDALSDQLPPLKAFILPAGHQAAGWAHVARTVCRRCERKASGLLAEEPQLSTQPAIQNILVYLNRLSDYLFIVARHINKVSGTPEKVWRKEQ